MGMIIYQVLCPKCGCFDDTNDDGHCIECDYDIELHIRMQEDTENNDNDNEIFQLQEEDDDGRPC